MNVKRIIITSAFATLCLLITGCASIVDGMDKQVRVNSKPPGAKFTIYDKEGKLVFANTTPATVTLERHHGFFDPEKYRLVFELQGYDTTEASVESMMNGWYVGNLFFGGILGFLIIDPATGAMWSLQPEEVNAQLWASSTNSAKPQTPPLILSTVRDANGFLIPEPSK